MDRNEYSPELAQKATSRSIEVENISNPLDNDVLLGRGRTLLDHPGNMEYQKLVSERRAEYQSTPRSEKMIIARAIVKTVRERRGRFLVRQRGTKLWTDVGDQCAINKTAQALREGQSQSQINERSSTPPPFASAQEPPRSRLELHEKVPSDATFAEEIQSSSMEMKTSKRQCMLRNDRIQVETTPGCEAGPDEDSGSCSDSDECLDVQLNEALALILTTTTEDDTNMEVSQYRPLQQPHSSLPESAFEPLPFETSSISPGGFDWMNGDELANLALAAADALGTGQQQQWRSERRSISPRYGRPASDSSIVLSRQLFLALKDSFEDEENTIMSAPEISERNRDGASFRKRRFSDITSGQGGSTL